MRKVQGHSTPGFRCSLGDLLVLVVAMVGSSWLGAQFAWAGQAVAFVVGHFFLFCNVFRISRGAELLWASVFVLLAGATLLTDGPGWGLTFVASALLAVVLVWREMRLPSYYGVAWRRMNPGLLANHEMDSEKGRDL